MTEKDKIVGIVGIYEFLDTIAETAARIFNATNVTFRRIEDNVLRVIGAAGPTAAKVREVLPDFPLEPMDPAVRSVFDNRQIQIESCSLVCRLSFGKAIHPR